MEENLVEEISVSLSVNCEDKVEETTLLKSIFMDVDVQPMKPIMNHTHGESAAVRSTSSRLIDRLAKSAGRHVTFYQGSSSDLRLGRKISRNYFWAKDAMAPPVKYEPDSDDLIAMVDVDYYVDMNTRLLNHFVPHVMYTFQPNAVSRDEGEYKYTFNARNEVVYTVSGGGSYKHRVWNWDGDSLSVKSLFWGYTYNVATYCVERRRMDDDHQLVLLSPLRRYKGFFMSWLAENFAQAKTLERLDVVDGEFLRLQINDRDRLWVSTGKVGGYTQCRIPARVDDTIAATKATLTQKLTLATVKSKMEDNDHSGDTSHQGAEVLLEYHRFGWKRPTQVSTLLDGLRRFQWIPPNKEADFDSKPSMVPFMRPILDGGFVPDDCIGNDMRAVEERVLKLKHVDGAVDNFTSRCMDEFVDLTLQGFVLEPYTNDMVYEKQNRPAQVRILDEAQHTSSTRVAKNFVKKEAYGRVNDPRMISTINGTDKMEYSAFIYALADRLKLMHWYAFSKSPRELSERVASICEFATTVGLTDFSRMDGRVDGVVREFERRLMLAGFPRKYHHALFKLMRNQHSLRGVTRNGVKYDTGLGRSSGSAETSSFNTALAAFTCYCAYRRQRNDHGRHFTPKEAWNKLGLYGGDDGLSADINPECAEIASKSVGQKLEINVVKRSEMGVTFLARHYGPDVWFGDSNTCCDLKRQLTKFHLTVHLPSNVSCIEKLQEKAYAFHLTDSNSPIIGPFVRKVLELFPMKKPFSNRIGMWNVEEDLDKQYSNYAEDWMADLFDRQVGDFDHAMFRDWLAAADEVTILNPPALAPSMLPNPKPGKVLVDDDIIVTQPEKENEPPKISAPPKGGSTFTKRVSGKRVDRNDIKIQFRPRLPKKRRPSRISKYEE
jgi:hypothetical protein